MKNKRTLITALFACLLWGSAFPTLKTMYTVMDVGSDYGIKMLLAGIRFVMAGAFILIYYTIRFKKAPVMKTWKQWQQVAVLGLLQTSLMYAFYYIGIYSTAGVKASILSQANIFLVVILAHFIYHDDKMHLGKSLGLIVGFCGILVVNFNSLNSVSGLFSFSWMGEGLLLVSGIFSTMSTFYVKKLAKGIPPILLNGWQIFLGGSVLTVVGTATAKESLNFSHPLALMLLVYSALLSSGAFTIWYILLQTNKASELAMIRFSIPVFGSILSALLLPGERLTIYILLGLVFVTSGIVLCNRPISGVKIKQVKNPFNNT